MNADDQRDTYGEELVKTFSDYLLANEPAMKYLSGRGISKSLINDTQVGYCPPFYNFWFPLMRGRITVPIRDAYGKLISFAGRIYEPSRESTLNQIKNIYHKSAADTQKAIAKWENAKWINEPYAKSQHLFNLNNAKNHALGSKYMIVVEGYFDVQVIADNGIPQVVALCGVNLSDKHCILLSRYAEHIILLLDSDQAGINSLIKIIPKIKEFGLIPHAVYLPHGYDPDEFMLKIGVKKMKLLIDKVLNESLEELTVKIN